MSQYVTNSAHQFNVCMYLLNKYDHCYGILPKLSTLKLKLGFSDGKSTDQWSVTTYAHTLLFASEYNKLSTKLGIF